MSTVALLILLYAMIGVIAGAVMLAAMIVNWGLCSGITMILSFIIIALLWPVAVPLIWAAIKENKKEGE